MADQFIPPGDIEYLAPWFNLIRAARAETITGKPCLLTVKILLDREGNPTLWPHIKSVGIEPKGRAEMTIVDLVGFFAP